MVCLFFSPRSFFGGRASGGWVSANNWWERSPNLSNSTNFMNVNNNGNNGNNNNASNVNAVVPGFAAM